MLVRGEPIKPYYGAGLRIFHRNFDKSCINYTKTAKSVSPISAGIGELRVLSLIRPQLYCSVRQDFNLQARRPGLAPRCPERVYFHHTPIGHQTLAITTPMYFAFPVSNLARTTFPEATFPPIAWISRRISHLSVPSANLRNRMICCFVFPVSQIT